MVENPDALEDQLVEVNPEGPEHPPDSLEPELMVLIPEEVLQSLSSFYFVW